jgi:RHS repeat-associated protein
LITTPYFDFKGNLLQSGHQFAKEYRENINWEDEVALEETTYKQYISYDAKNRAKQTILPDGTITQYEYNARGLEKCITSRLHDEDPDTAAVPQADCNEKKTVTVNNIEYDARGQRKLIDHGNGVHTSYSYHPLTFLMTNLRTRRGSGPLLQDLSYIHDPVGNVTHIRDDAQQTIFFRNRRVEPSSDYTYDAVYRLVEAAGREHLGQTDGRSGPTPIAPSASDSFNVRLDLPSDGNAMGTYIETYFYDKVGNMQTVKHRSCDPRHPGWTRKYVYNERSQLEPSKFSNRLSATSIGSITESYRYDGLSGLLGNMTAMAHLSSMKWDYRNQLRSTSRQTVKSGGAPETTWYVYNAAGQRVRKVTERQGTAEQTSPILSKERVYLGDFELYRKYGGDGSRLTLERETVHITDTRQSRIALAETRTQGSEPGGVPSRLIRYQLGNHLDSAVLELDDQAQIISYEEYFPFGSTSFQGVRSQLETPKRYRFTGKERDEENGLYYYGARYYAPWLARWTSCDPEGLADGSNLYVYARDSPTVLVDPDGRESTSQWKQMDYGTGESSKYYHLEGTDIYRRDTPRFSEAWHEGGGDQAVEFADDKITATVVTPEKILADSQKLDRSSFYLKYRTIFTPEQMKQVLQYVPYAPILKLPPGSNWIYMGEGGRVGTEDELAEAELAEKLENIHPPSEIGALYGIAATVLGADAKNVAHMIQVGDQLNNIVSPILSMTIMASAAKNKTEGGSLDVTKPGFSTDTTTSPTPDVVQPPTNARSPLVDWHYDPAMTPQEAVQDLADMVHAKLTGNRALISDYLSDSEIQFAARGPWAERMVFGKALERAMGEAAAPSGLLVQTGDALMNQKGSPDLMGLPGTPFQGLEFQVTTVNQYRRGVHESKDGTLFILHNGL